MASKTYTRAEVAQHSTRTDCWVSIENNVYDVTKFLKLHPGGVAFLLDNAGKDVTALFFKYHHRDVLTKYQRLCVGTLTPGEFTPKIPKSPFPDSFGDMVPYGDPSWYQRLKSPYYKPTHIAFRSRVRAFVEKEILPTMMQWAEKDQPPSDLYQKMGQEGFLACMHGPPFPAKYLPSTITPPPQDFDYFHELILYDEIARCGLSGVIGALTNGPSIGMSAIMRFGSEAMKQRISPDVFLGRHFIALAISEPAAGSDVANVKCRAVKDGDFYVVNGCKKWITNGTYAQYFVVAVQTDPKGGHNGLSLLLVERDMPGFSTRKINIRNSDISGTAFLEFENVRVPAANLIGKENQGFRYIMYNFNHERFYVCVCGGRLSRVCLEECIKYAMQREAFGKPLSEQPVIRAKIAAMTRAVEQYQAWLESITYQMCNMSHEEAMLKLGDVICLLKSQMSRTFEYCARETTHIFGGNSMHVGSLGKKVEPMVASVKGYAIPAGAEDVMDDYAARELFKMAKKYSKL